MSCYKLDKNNIICKPDFFNLNFDTELNDHRPFFCYSLFEALNNIKKKYWFI